MLPEPKPERASKPELRMPHVGSKSRLPNRKLVSEFVRIVEQLESAEAMLEVHEDKDRFNELNDRYLDLLVKRHREEKGEIARDHALPVDITDEEFRKVVKEVSDRLPFEEEKSEGSAIVREVKDIFSDSLGLNGFSGFFNHETVSYEDAVDVAKEGGELAMSTAESAYRVAQAVDKGLWHVPSRSLEGLQRGVGFTVKLRHEPDAEQRREIAESQKNHAEYKLREFMRKLEYRASAPLDGIINDRPEQKQIVQEKMELLATAMACQQIIDRDSWDDNLEMFSQLQLYAEAIEDEDFARMGYDVAHGRDTVNEASLLHRLGVVHEPSLDRTWLNSSALLGFNQARAIADCLKLIQFGEEQLEKVTSGVALAETEQARQAVVKETRSAITQLHRELTATLTTSIYSGVVYGHDFAPRLDNREQVAAFHLIAELKRREAPHSVSASLIAQTAANIPDFTENSIGSYFEPDAREAISNLWTEEGLHTKPASKMSDEELYAAWHELTVRNPLLEQEAGALYTSVDRSIEAYQGLFQSIHDTSQQLEKTASQHLGGAVTADASADDIRYSPNSAFEAITTPLQRLSIGAEEVLRADLGTSRSTALDKLNEFEAMNQHTPAQAVAAQEFISRVQKLFAPQSP